MFWCVKTKTGDTEYIPTIPRPRLGVFWFLFVCFYLLHFIQSLCKGFLHVKCNDSAANVKKACPNHNQEIYDKKWFSSRDKFAHSTIFLFPFVPSLFSFMANYSLWFLYCFVNIPAMGNVLKRKADLQCNHLCMFKIFPFKLFSHIATAFYTFSKNYLSLHFFAQTWSIHQGYSYDPAAVRVLLLGTNVELTWTSSESFTAPNRSSEQR